MRALLLHLFFLLYFASSTADAQSNGCRFLLDDCAPPTVPPGGTDSDVFFNGQPFISRTTMGTFRVVYGPDGFVTHEETNCRSRCQYFKYRYTRTIDGVCMGEGANRHCYVLRNAAGNTWQLYLKPFDQYGSSPAAAWRS